MRGPRVGMDARRGVRQEAGLGRPEGGRPVHKVPSLREARDPAASPGAGEAGPDLSQKGTASVRVLVLWVAAIAEFPEVGLGFFFLVRIDWRLIGSFGFFFFVGCW